MKKSNRVIVVMCIGALLAVGSASCKKNDTTKTSSFTFELPAVEGFSAEEGKAYIDIAASSQMKWWDGDKIKVYSVDATNTTPVTADFTAEAGCSGKTVAKFTGEDLTKGSYGYFAFYPYDKAVSVAEGNLGTFNVSAMQTYNPALNFAGTSMAGRAFMDPQGVVGACPCDVLNGSANGVIKHIFGFANVKIKDTSSATAGKKVTSVTITDNNMHLTGNITVNIAELTTARLEALKALGTNYYNGNVGAEAYMAQLNEILHEIDYTSVPDGNSVTLDCSAADVTLASVNKFFIIPLRPGALVKDFTVTVEFDDKTSQDFNFNDKMYICRPGTFSNIQCTF